MPTVDREDLRARYDVQSLVEDEWHSFTGEQTNVFLDRALSGLNSGRILNAGSGIYELGRPELFEISFDLFARPIRAHKRAVCGSVEALPFASTSFDCVVSVGEVLAYCDPAAAIGEFARVLSPTGLMVLDFSSSRSCRYWARTPYGRAADFITDIYNGHPEKHWIYDPHYIVALLNRHGFKVAASAGTHILSAFLRRLGVSASVAVTVQRRLTCLRLPMRFADLVTIAAARTKI